MVKSAITCDPTKKTVVSQIIGQMRNIDVPFHWTVAEYIRIAGVTQLNLELLQLSCIFGNDDYAFYTKVRGLFWLPFLLFGTLGLIGCLHHLLRAKSISGTDPTAPSSQLASFGCGLFNILYAPRSILRTCPGIDGIGQQVLPHGLIELACVRLRAAVGRDGAALPCATS